MFAALLLFCLCIPAVPALTLVEPGYSPAGPVTAGESIMVQQDIFVGNYFDEDYTLEFSTDLAHPVWTIELVSAGSVVKGWDFSVSNPKIDGFTISMPDYETELVTRVSGIPPESATEITLWNMRVLLGNGGVKDEFTAKPVPVHPPAVSPAETVPAMAPSAPVPAEPVSLPSPVVTTAIPASPPAATESPVNPLVFPAAGLVCAGVPRRVTA
jgi:hypothetical protein